MPLALVLELLQDGLHLVRLGAAQGAQLGRESFCTLARRRAERLLHHLLVLEPLERIVALGGHLGHLLGVPGRLFLGGRAVLLRTRKLFSKHGHLLRLLLERELGRIAPLLELHVLRLRRRQRAARRRRRRRRRRAALPKHVARVRCLTSGRLECGTSKQKSESKLRRPCPLILSGHARGHRGHRLRGATRHRRPCERPTRLVELGERGRLGLLLVGELAAESRHDELGGLFGTLERLGALGLRRAHLGLEVELAPPRTRDLGVEARDLVPRSAQLGVHEVDRAAGLGRLGHRRLERQLRLPQLGLGDRAAAAAAAAAAALGRAAGRRGGRARPATVGRIEASLK